MKTKIAKCILTCMGWKVFLHEDMRKYPKSIVIAAPHTSRYDFVLGKLAFLSIGISSKILITHLFFFPPFGWILKKLGGFPLNKKSPKMAIGIINTIKTADQFVLVVCPEGQLEPTSDWGNGFYKIAKKTNVPIFVSVIDYQKKKFVIGVPFVITGDFDVDMIQLDQIYHKEQAKHPKNFLLHGQKEYE